MARVKRHVSCKYLNVRVPVALLERLDCYASKSRLPKNAITEMALDQYLESKGEGVTQ